MESPHIPMVGFLVSHKTLNGEFVRNKRYPPVSLLPYMMRESRGKVLNMIHYNSRKVDSLSEQVSKLFDGIYENRLCQAIQLNIHWPDIRQVKKIKDKYPDMRIVFQSSAEAMRGSTPREIARGIARYEDLLSYVLIDPSGGRGDLFDSESSVALYSELKDKCPDLTVGFAGGLNGDNATRELERIVSRVGGDICVDVESGVRIPISSIYGDDFLDISKSRKFLEAVSSVLK
jgi:phosphoribosylanthranilate isomerase